MLTFVKVWQEFSQQCASGRTGNGRVAGTTTKPSTAATAGGENHEHVAGVEPSHHLGELSSIGLSTAGLLLADLNATGGRELGNL